MYRERVKMNKYIECKSTKSKLLIHPQSKRGAVSVAVDNFNFRLEHCIVIEAAANTQSTAANANTIVSKLNVPFRVCGRSALEFEMSAKAAVCPHSELSTVSHQSESSMPSRPKMQENDAESGSPSIVPLNCFNTESRFMEMLTVSDCTTWNGLASDGLYGRSKLEVSWTWSVRLRHGGSLKITHSFEGQKRQ